MQGGSGPGAPSPGLEQQRPETSPGPQGLALNFSLEETFVAALLGLISPCSAKKHIRNLLRPPLIRLSLLVP